jgi:hypothetical protein
MPIVSGAPVTPAGTSTEVFHRDHRNLNGNSRVDNDLVRYTLHPGDNAPLIEVWDSVASAWSTVGGFQLRTTNSGPILPLQSYALGIISPEEVTWEERRYDSNGTALVRLLGRIRRGSRLIEWQIVAASGAGLTDTQSIALVGAVAGTWAAATSGDSTGIAFTAAGVNQVPGFAFLTTPPAAASVGGTSLYSGATVPAGTVTRLSTLAGYQDAMYAALSTPAAYAQRWAAYNRTRIRQRLLV